MRTSDFDYELPKDLIAQEPADPRDASRLLVLRRGGALEDRVFRDLPGLLPPRTLLVFNDTRVFPARLFARRSTGGRVELLLVEPLAEPGEAGEVWEAFCRPARRLKPGEWIELDTGASSAEPIRLQVVRKRPDGLVEVSFPTGAASVLDLAHRYGSVPLPPYIRRPAHGRDRERYQTVYAARDGSVAAPTAGLHFTEQVLRACREQGHEFAYVTLHVGPGTFRPVETERVEDHVMHSERFVLWEETARAVERARREGRTVLAVGTTVVRVLESRADEAGHLTPGEGRTALFIRPGYRFKVVDALLTNFHLPRSTLLMLVCAFRGREAVLRAYGHAVASRYRFYSYGDAMLLL